MTSEEVRKVLTRRDVELLRALADGLRHRQAAERLHVSQSTLERRLDRIKDKLCADTSIAAAVIAVRAGVV